MLEETLLKLRYKRINEISNILQETLTEISQKQNHIIICNYMNKMALDLICDGAIPKKHFITLKTEKDGILGGYILLPCNSCLSSKIIKYLIDGEEVSFLKKCNFIKVEYFNKVKRSYIHAFTNQQGQFITSDLDIIMICAKGKIALELMATIYNMGNILKYEYDIIKIINETFTNKLTENGLYSFYNIIPLISHGPFNRYHKTNLEDINFPITIYHPDKGEFSLGLETNREKSIIEFLEMCNSFDLSGYKCQIHCNWMKL